jgi:hypothetical protein
MKARHRKSLNALAGLMLAIAAGAGTYGAAWAQATLANIANNDGIFIDVKTFEVRGGKAKADVAGQIKALGARELGGGAIIFRSGDKLYIVGGSGDQSALLPPEGPIHVQYEDAKDPNLKEIYDLVKAKRGLETFREFLTPFRLPEDLYIKALGCNGVANSYFFRENNVPTIRICYEYLKEIHEKLPKEATPEGIEPHDALVGQLLFTLLHEFGHAAFDMYNVPIFGRQEDAADQFAAYVMLQFGGERAHRRVRGAAYSYKGFIRDLKDKPKVTLPLAAFSSDHGSPEERFYNLACIAYGYDSQNFASLIDKEYLPERRAKVCKYEYSNLRYAFRTMISPHIDVARAREVLARTWRPEGNARAPEK